MAQMGRPGLSAGEKKELWRRWKDGQTLSEIGIALGKHAGSVHGVLRARGGIAPVTRSRAARSLSSADREEISRGLVAGLSLRKIAEQLERAPSTVSGSLHVMGGGTNIGLLRPTSEAGSRRCVPSHVTWPGTIAYAASLRPNSRTTGPRNRLRGGWRSSTARIRRCVFLTRRSTAACSFRPAAS